MIGSQGIPMHILSEIEKSSMVGKSLNINLENPMPKHKRGIKDLHRVFHDEIGWKMSLWVARRELCHSGFLYSKLVGCLWY